MASKKFSQKLRDLRLKAGYTQKQVYERFDIPQSTFSSWEVGKSEPSGEMLIKLCDFYNCDMLSEFSTINDSGNVTYAELQIIEKYRDLDPYGQETVSYILDRESERTRHIADLESRPDNIIEFNSNPDETSRLVEYFNSASAGTGIFIMGNEATEQLPIPDTEENKKVDYAIKVSGNSMEPDFHDGDIALVSHREELNYGDVGIFIINNNAYIKEYGETELISRNPKADNITIEKHDNIVCMGKVIGKL